MTALPRAVLDTNVIFSRVLHELFGRLSSESRLANLIWSNELLDAIERAGAVAFAGRARTSEWLA